MSKAAIFELNNFACPTAVASGYPTLAADQSVSSGTKFLFDFCDSVGNLNVPNTNLLNGASFPNLVGGVAPAASLVISAGTPSPAVTNLTGLGGLYWTSNGGANTTQLDLGITYDINGGGNHEFLFVLWQKWRAARGNYTQFAGQTSSGGQGAGGWSFGTIGNGNYMSACVGGAAGEVYDPSLLTLNVVHQFAFHWKPGTLMELYRDGALVAQVGVNVATTTAPGAGTNHLLIGDNYSQMTLYRTLMEDLQVSGNNAATVIAADYANNAGRFT